MDGEADTQRGQATCLSPHSYCGGSGSRVGQPGRREGDPSPGPLGGRRGRGSAPRALRAFVETSADVGARLRRGARQLGPGRGRGQAGGTQRPGGVRTSAGDTARPVRTRLAWRLGLSGTQGPTAKGRRSGGCGCGRRAPQGQGPGLPRGHGGRSAGRGRYQRRALSSPPRGRVPGGSGGGSAAGSPRGGAGGALVRSEAARRTQHGLGPRGLRA